jgi:hypothetical protein
MNRTVERAVTAALAVLAGSASAEVPPALAERLLAIGPVINPGATASLLPLRRNQMSARFESNEFGVLSG